MTDEELEAKMQPKEERMMEAFQEGLKSSTFFIEEAQDDANTPTFDIWRMICKDEIKRREKEAEENMITIIGTLEEERATQQTPVQKSKQKGSTSKLKSASQPIVSEDIMKKLQEVNETMQQQNKLWWEVMENIQADKDEYEKKIEILREKLMGRWKVCAQLEKEKSTAMMLLGRKEVQIAALKLKVEDLEMKLDERDILDSEVNLMLDQQEFETPPSKKKNKKAPVVDDQEFETPTCKKKKNKKTPLVDDDINQENWKSLNEMQDMDDFMDDPRNQRKTRSSKKRINAKIGQTSRKKNKANKDKDVSVTQALEDMCAEHEASLQRDLSIGKELVIRQSPRRNKETNLKTGSARELSRTPLKIANEDLGNENESGKRSARISGEKMEQGGIGAMTPPADTTNNDVADTGKDTGKDKAAVVPRKTRLNTVMKNLTKTMTTSRVAMKAMQNFNIGAKLQISPCPVIMGKRKRKSNVNTNLYTYELRNKMKKTRVQREG